MKYSLFESFNSDTMSQSVREHGMLLTSYFDVKNSDFCGMDSICRNAASPIEYDMITDDIILGEYDSVDDACEDVYDIDGNLDGITNMSVYDSGDEMIPYYRYKVVLFEDGSVILIDDTEKSAILQKNAKEKVEYRRSKKMV